MITIYFPGRNPHSWRALLTVKIKLKVQSVRAIRDPEGRECYQIDFVEIRPKPPMMIVTPQEIPEEIGQMVIQISKGLQRVLPGADVKEYEVRKLTLILTHEELEAFNLKPYPNQLYELTITDGTLHFKPL